MRSIVIVGTLGSERNIASHKQLDKPLKKWLHTCDELADEFEDCILVAIPAELLTV